VKCSSRPAQAKAISWRSSAASARGQRAADRNHLTGRSVSTVSRLSVLVQRAGGTRWSWVRRARSRRRPGWPRTRSCRPRSARSGRTWCAARPPALPCQLAAAASALPRSSPRRQEARARCHGAACAPGSCASTCYPVDRNPMERALSLQRRGMRGVWRERRVAAAAPTGRVRSPRRCSGWARTRPRGPC